MPKPLPFHFSATTAVDTAVLESALREDGYAATVKRRDNTTIRVDLSPHTTPDGRRAIGSYVKGWLKGFATV